MTRYLIWYIDTDNRHGHYGAHHWPYSRVPVPRIPYHGWQWYKTKAEAEQVAELMRKDKFWYKKVWITKHNT